MGREPLADGDGPGLFSVHRTPQEGSDQSGTGYAGRIPQLRRDKGWQRLRWMEEAREPGHRGLSPRAVGGGLPGKGLGV